MTETATATATIRLLLADDHQITRRGLRNLLGAYPEFEIVGEAGSLAETLEVVAQLKPDLLLLDVRFPDGNGIEVCRRLQRMDFETKVLILTSHADDDLLFEAIAEGADGYLLKEIDETKLVQSIMDVVAGKSILDPALTRRVMNRIRTYGATAATSNKLDLLSPQERRVLSFVAQGKTNKEIGAAMGLSDKTVKNYLSNAMEKLQLTRRSHAAAVFISHSKGTQEAE